VTGGMFPGSCKEVINAAGTSLTSSEFQHINTFLDLPCVGMSLLILDWFATERNIFKIPKHYLPIDAATHHNIWILGVELKRENL